MQVPPCLHRFSGFVQSRKVEIGVVTSNSIDEVVSNVEDTISLVALGSFVRNEDIGETRVVSSVYFHGTVVPLDNIVTFGAAVTGIL